MATAVEPNREKQKEKNRLVCLLTSTGGAGAKQKRTCLYVWRGTKIYSNAVISRPIALAWLSLRTGAAIIDASIVALMWLFHMTMTVDVSVELTYCGAHSYFRECRVCWRTKQRRKKSEENMEQHDDQFRHFILCRKSKQRTWNVLIFEMRITWTPEYCCADSCAMKHYNRNGKTCDCIGWLERDTIELNTRMQV